MFFSVKEPMKIFGKKFIPCICYEATRQMEATINHLAEEGKVRVYDRKVFFQNGKVIKSLEERKKEEKEKKKLLKDAKKKEESKNIQEKEDFEDSDF